MEDYRQFTVIGRNGDVKMVHKIYATTKWHALDIAYYKYPLWLEYQCNNVVRTRNDQRKSLQAESIIQKF